MPLFEQTKNLPNIIPAYLTTGFSIDSISREGELIFSIGKVGMRDITAKADDPLKSFSVSWKATVRFVASELSEWVIGLQATEKPQHCPTGLLDGLLPLASCKVKEHLISHPQALVLKKDLQKPPVITRSKTETVSTCAAPRPPKEQKVIPFPKAATEAPSKNPPAEYTGAREKYLGDCVCEELESSSARTPFDWLTRTKGKFPQRCFECSCGTRWWCSRPTERWWSRVSDSTAWYGLCDHNGIPPWPLGYDEEHRVCLLGSLRDKRLPSEYCAHTEG